MYYGLFKHVLLGPPLKGYYRPWAEGTENVPESGGAILAANHLSFSDSVFLPLVLKRKVVFLGKEEYFTGSGAMNPLLIGVSLFATLLSTISYLSMPGESLGKGPVGMVGILALPLIYVAVGYWLLPIYMKQRVTSAYELLEDRLGTSIRLLGATMFITLRLVWMSLLVYLAAKAMTVMLGVGVEWIPLIVLATGFVAVIYTSLGGLQAVVITDLLQTVLLFGGAILVLVMVTIDFGGFGWFPTVWRTNWDTQPLFPPDAKTRVSFLGTIVSGFLWYVCTSGGDQTTVQRFMATKDAQAARRALATQLTVGAVVGITLGLVGFALLSYFERHASALPASISLKDNADLVFPHYIAFHLPVGVSGLVVAAMFAAAMSSIDSGVNSITAVVMTDYLDRFGLRPQSERGHLRLAQLLAFGIGGLVVVGSSFMQHVPGNITAMTQKSTNLLVTPIFALFVFALFIPFARPLGVWVGAVCGTATAVVTAFSGPIVQWLAEHRGVDPAAFGTEWATRVNQTSGALERYVVDPISVQWIALCAWTVNLLTGSLASLLVARFDHSDNVMGRFEK
ncbi:MAG: sodium/solute symporter [Planctomycetaceae bacterium]